MSNNVIEILKNKFNDIVAIFMIIILYGIIRFLNVGITGGITGIIVIYFVQAILLKKYPTKDISSWAGEKTKDNEEIKKFAINFLTNSMKKVSLICLCLMPILYYFEIRMDNSIKIKEMFYLNRVLCGIIITFIVVIMGYPIVRVEKEINKKFM